MAWDSRGRPDLPPGPARELVDLLQRLRRTGKLTGGQIAVRTGLSASHISEVMRGWKAPSPQAAGKIAEALGADGGTVARARRLAEDLADLNQHNRRRERRGTRGPDGERAPGAAGLAAHTGNPVSMAPVPGLAAGRDVTPRRLGALVGRSGVWQVLRTPLGRRILMRHSLVALGLVSAVIQFIAAIFHSFPPYPQLTFAASLGICAAWGLSRATPRFHFQHKLKDLDVSLSIVVGDLFEQDTHLAVGFTDTFDTSVDDDLIIHSSSVQGQLLNRLFGGDQQTLDQQLAAALRAVSPVRAEPRAEKPYGKLDRYQVGTVAVLGEPRRLIFAVAYGRMGNDLVVQATAEDLWHSFHQLWDAVYARGQRGPVSIPLMGSGLARMDNLGRGNLLRLILLSFVAYSRLRLICHEMRIVIRPEDIERVDLISFREFLNTL